MSHAGPLLPQQLYRVCDCERFDFETTADLPDQDKPLGQDRALEALAFGAEIPHADYHIFLLGSEGLGRHSSAHRVMAEQAKERPTPSDWVYVHNFKEPHRPRAIALPAGRGAALKQYLHYLIDEVRNAVPATLERPENQRRLQALEEQFRSVQEQALEKLGDEAKEKGIALVRTPQGFGFAPLKGEEIIKPEDYAKLSKEEQARLQTGIQALQEKLKEVLQALPKVERERRQALHTLVRELTAFAVSLPIGELRAAFHDVEEVQEYLNEVQEDLVQNVQGLIAAEQQAQAQGPEENGGNGSVGQVPGLKRYEVNLLVDHSAMGGAPVIYEDNPTLVNLIGRAEHVARFGALSTDFTLIKPGALHRANGGYLILDAEALLRQPLAWEALKRNLKAKHITIESPGQALSMVSTISLEPEPIPLAVKIALCGSREIFYLLQQYDLEFSQHFKVAADFEEEMDRNLESDRGFARLISTIVRREKLLAFDRTGVARVIEQMARLADDSEKLSLNLQAIYDLTREADYFARKEGAKLVTAAHVRTAIEARVRRSDRIRERSHESITRQIMLISTQGTEVGQINGLSVMQLGGFAFGKPTRITATVRLGSGRVLDIEREVKLGGPLHSKGVLILSGFLGSTFLPDRPFSIAASLVFEQSYGGVDGDSASSTELYAILSALSGLGIDQGLAVTGSVNQLGEVQAIGGVNEKIEGFFDICKARGLTGKQGVLIPHANVVHLMLREDVVQAVSNAQFHIYPVKTIAEGIEILTGVEAGERDSDGNFPSGSVYRRVEDRLAALARERMKALGRGDGGAGERSGD